jgi:hypothetical protein
MNIDFVCLNLDGDYLNEIEVILLIEAAHKLRAARKANYILADEERTIEFAVKTDFRVHTLGDITGFLFRASISKDSVVRRVEYLVPCISAKPPTRSTRPAHSLFNQGCAGSNALN